MDAPGSRYYYVTEIGDFEIEKRHEGSWMIYWRNKPHPKLWPSAKAALDDLLNGEALVDFVTEGYRRPTFPPKLEMWLQAAPPDVIEF